MGQDLLLDERDLLPLAFVLPVLLRLLDRGLDELPDRVADPLLFEPDAVVLDPPEDDFFFAADDRLPVEPLPEDFAPDDELRFGELLDFCCDPLEDLACGPEPLDPFDEPLLPASLLTPPARVLATPIPSSPTFFQSVRRRPTGRPSTVERRVSLRGLFMCCLLRRCRPGRFPGVVRRCPGASPENWAIWPVSTAVICGIDAATKTTTELRCGC